MFSGLLFQRRGQRQSHQRYERPAGKRYANMGGRGNMSAVGSVSRFELTAIVTRTKPALC